LGLSTLFPNLPNCRTTIFIKKINIIKKTVEELLNTIHFKGDVSIDDLQSDDILVNIQTEHAGFLMVKLERILDALQHIARILVIKKTRVQLHLF